MSSKVRESPFFCALLVTLVSAKGSIEEPELSSSQQEKARIERQKLRVRASDDVFAYDVPEYP